MRFFKVCSAFLSIFLSQTAFALTPLEDAIQKEGQRVSASVKKLIMSDSKVDAILKKSKTLDASIKDLEGKIAQKSKEVDAAQSKFDSLKESPQKNLVALFMQHERAVSDFEFYYDMLGLVDEIVTQEADNIFDKLKAGNLNPDEEKSLRFRLQIVMTPMSSEEVEKLNTLEKNAEEDARDEFGFAAFKPDVLKIDPETKKPMSPKTYVAIRNLENALQKLIATLPEKERPPFQMEREVLHNLTTASDAIAKASAENIELDQFQKDFIQSQQKRNEELSDLKKKLGDAIQQSNLVNYQSLSRAMTAIINETNRQSSKKGAGNEDKDLSVAFFLFMSQLEIFELAMYKKYGSENPYPTVGWTELGSQLQKAVGFGDFDRPLKMDLMVDFHLARHGRLGLLNAPGNLAGSIKSIFTNAGKTFSAAASRNWLTSGLKDNILSVGDLGKFAYENPLIASEIATNLFEAYKLANTSDPSLAKEIWNNIETIYQVTETRSVVVDLFLGNNSVYSEQSGNKLISLDVLTLYKASWWAPVLVSAYLGLTGQTTLRRMANYGLKIGGFVGTGLGYFLGMPALTIPSFMATSGSVAFDAVAGFAQLSMIRSARSRITPNNELWVSSFLRGIKKLSDTGDLKETGSFVAKYALGRTALHQTSLFVEGLSKGTLKDYLKDFGSCVKENKGVAVTSGIAGTVGGTILAGFLVTAASTAFLPLTVIAGLGTGVCIGATKLYDYLSGKQEKRDLAKKEKQLDTVAQNLPKNADAGLQEAIEKISEADKKQMVKKLERFKDPDEFAAEAWKLYQEKISEKLTELETAHLTKLAQGVGPYPDKRLDPLFTDMASAEVSVRGRAIDEASAILAKEERSAEKEKVASISYLKSMMTRLKDKAGPIDIKALQKDWNLYQIGVISDRTAERISAAPKS